MSNFTVPGLADADVDTIRTSLQERLYALIDTHLMLKHIHWNVVGPSFIGVHEMLDPQVVLVQGMADTLAERIAALGGAPIGVTGKIASERTWDDYPLNKALVPDHLEALDVAYSGIIAGHRAAISTVDPIDPVTGDMLIGQTGELEQFQWFVRAHLESGTGQIPTRDKDLAAANGASN